MTCLPRADRAARWALASARVGGRMPDSVSAPEMTVAAMSPSGGGLSRHARGEACAVEVAARVLGQGARQPVEPALGQAQPALHRVGADDHALADADEAAARAVPDEHERARSEVVEHVAQVLGHPGQCAPGRSGALRPRPDRS